MTLRQRQPREEDPAYLAYVRTLPCLVCRRPGPSDPAHLRTAARQYGKPSTGLGEKPSDCWVLPLCRNDHDDQHRNNELALVGPEGLSRPVRHRKGSVRLAPGPNPAAPTIQGHEVEAQQAR